MDTLAIVLIMMGVALVLLLGAVIADRQLSRRIERRESGEGSGSPRKADPADAVIDLLDRARSAMRHTVESAHESTEQGS